MNEEFLKIIDDLDVDDAKKSDLRARLGSGEPNSDLIAEVGAILDGIDRNLAETYPTEMGELAKITEDARREIQVEYDAFNHDMQGMEQEAAQIGQDAEKEIEEIVMEDARASLN